MENNGLLVKMTAKTGKELELYAFLQEALPLAQAELGTRSWYALRIDSQNFGIFDTFSDEASRNQHIGGDIAKALFAKAPDLLEGAPVIEKVDVIAVKKA